MSLTTSGLTNIGLGPGVTTHYSFSYDSALSQQDGLKATNGLMAKAEADFALMQSWFGGIGIPFSYPLAVQITTNSGGAGWSSPSGFLELFGSGSFIHLDPGPGKSADFLRYLLVAEVTEMMMLQQGSGWFTGHGTFSGGDEGSMGEGLSRFLSTQLLVVNNLLGKVPPAGFAVGTLWLNGGRPNFIDSDPDDNQPDPTTGCTTVFIYYLFSQLGISIQDIIQAGSSSMSGVFQNLRGSNQGWNDFIELVNLHYPPSVAYHPVGDDIFPVSDLIGLTLPNRLISGYSGTGEVKINTAAMAEVIVRLSTDHASIVSVPSSLTIPVGATSAQFTVEAVEKSLPLTPNTAKVTASYAGQTKTATVTIVSPQIASLSVSPAAVICGDQAVVTVTLNAASTKGSAPVSLESSDASLMTITSANPLPIVQGDLSATCIISTPNIPAGFPAKTVTLKASLGGNTQTLAIQVVSPTVKTLTIVPNPVQCGAQATATVTLDRVSHDGDIVAALSWEPANFVPIQATVTVPAEQISATFPIKTPNSIPPLGYSQALLYASYDENNCSEWLNLLPSADQGVLASLQLSTLEVAGGQSLAGTVTLEAAVITDTLVTLGASQDILLAPGRTVPLPSVSLPANVTILAGEIDATFSIVTHPLPVGSVSKTMSIFANAVNTKIVKLTWL